MFRPEDNTSQERKASAVGQSLIRWMSAAVVWIFLLSAAVSAEAAPQWKQVSEHIHQTIRQSLDIYESGDPELAKKPSMMLITVFMKKTDLKKQSGAPLRQKMPI